MTRCGIDVLLQSNYAALANQRIGLITNHTGRDETGSPTRLLLHRTPLCELTAIFSPEHGIHGALDEQVPDSLDEETGLRVFSLYGNRNTLDSELLTTVDTLVYDIQDIGTRFYTYISTLLNCMTAAATYNKRFVVLDRPNPIGGIGVEGGLADSERLDFVACHPIPIRHGMTVGEIAKLMAAERNLALELEVIPLEAWQRANLWDETGLIWCNPSPNMRSLTQALLYPGIGLLEFTNLSVGRGTDTPFQVIGAPWLNSRRFAALLNQSGLTGVRFIPIEFEPTYSTFANTQSNGIEICITERSLVLPTRIGMTIATLLRDEYPNVWDSKRFDRLLVHHKTYEAFLAGASADALCAAWVPEEESFRLRREPFLMYP